VLAERRRRYRFSSVDVQRDLSPAVLASTRGSIRRRALAALAALALLGALTPEAGANAAPTRVQVVAKEFYYLLSRQAVEAGPAIIQLVDFGQDPHDLRVQRRGGGPVYGTPIIQPGSVYNLRIDLRPGTYELWCSVADHRKLGMEATLIVRPDPR
jgi:hypothetical protein